MALIPPPAFEFKHLPWTERSTAWERWSRSLDYFVVAAGVISVKQKHGLLLYLGGMDLQDVYETLAPQSTHIERGDVTNEYEAAMTMLTEHFNPTRAAGNPRQRGNENRELPRDDMEPHTQENSAKTSPVHSEERKAAPLSDKPESDIADDEPEPERETEHEPDRGTEPEPERETKRETDISENKNEPEPEIFENESTNKPESENEREPDKSENENTNMPERENEPKPDNISDMSESENNMSGDKLLTQRPESTYDSGLREITPMQHGLSKESDRKAVNDDDDDDDIDLEIDDHAPPTNAVPRDANAVPTPSAPRWSSRHTRPPPRPPDERLQCDVENFYPLDVQLSLGRNR